jgi:hypothetical protein
MKVLKIGHNEYVKYIYKTSNIISSNSSSSEYIIFILSKNAEKPHIIDKILPFFFKYQQQNKLYFPPVSFSTPNISNTTVNGIPMVWTGKSDFIFFGPFQTIPKGCWEVQFLFDCVPMYFDSKPEHQCRNITLDIVSRQGQICYFQRRVSLEEFKLPIISRLKIDSQGEQLEFRAYSDHICNTQTDNINEHLEHIIFKGILLKRLSFVFDDIIPSSESIQDIELERQVERQLESIYRSRSWRITQPLRFIAGILRGERITIIFSLKKRIKSIIIYVIHFCRRNKYLNALALLLLKISPRLKVRLRMMEINQVHSSLVYNGVSPWNREILIEINKYCK